MLSFAKYITVAFLLLFAAPLAGHGALYWKEGWPRSWRDADWSSAGLLPAAWAHQEAMVRIYAARTGRWKGIFAVHSWIVVKDRGASSYERYDVVGWGKPLRVNGYAADARWFGGVPETVFAADGAAAERLIPGIRKAVETYRYGDYGDYRIWPGPNSNTFVAAVIASVPGLNAVLPPTAIGKDYPYDGHWFARVPSGLGFRISLGGYAGLTIGWYEGFEINLLGGVLGVDLRRPAIKLPGFGRIGLPAQAPVSDDDAGPSGTTQLSAVELPAGGDGDERSTRNETTVRTAGD